MGCSLWGHEESDTTERLHFHFHFPALEKDMAPAPVFLPGESQGRGSLVGGRLWGRTESGTTEATQQQQQPTAQCELCRANPLRLSLRPPHKDGVRAPLCSAEAPR